MQTLLLWIFALYGVSTVVIQFRKWLHHSRRKTSIHYCLYTYNSQGNIEWMIRYLAQLAILEGRSFRFSVYDYGSIDDTLAIVEYLRRDGLFIELLPNPPEMEGRFSPEQEKLKQLGRVDDAHIVVDLRESFQPVASCC